MHQHNAMAVCALATQHAMAACTAVAALQCNFPTASNAVTQARPLRPSALHRLSGKTGFVAGGAFLQGSSRPELLQYTSVKGRQLVKTHRVVMSAQTASSMEKVSQVVQVDLGDRTYPIYIGAGLLDQGHLLRQHVPGNRVLIVTNETVAPLYLDRCVAAFTGGNDHDAATSAPGGKKPKKITVDHVILPDGEEYKTMEVLMKVFDAALEKRLDRQCTFVALGGGVIGDMTGFAAAAYQRGVHFIQIPTTLLAMVDSSVGGKTGVNHPLGKNMIGAFYQPRCVLIDTLTLNTLPRRELSAGVAEIVKYGLIMDAPLFTWLEANMEALMACDPAALLHAIKRSCEDKADVVTRDEREGGLRAILNLGHTFGHAIETGVGYGNWLHGEAVAAGMVMASDMSHRLGWIDGEITQRLIKLLRRAECPVTAPKEMTVDKFRELMMVDKKVANGVLRLILLKGPLGNCVFTSDFDPKKLDETLETFCSAAR
eukprot:jgi/Mesvir1/19084/Mv12837-RA.1